MITKVKNDKTNLLKNISLTVLIISIGFVIIYNSQATSKGVKAGIGYCTDILIPSLFPIMFLSKFIVASNVLEFLKKPLDKIMKVLFYLPGSTAPVILLSLIGGYPVGAIGVQTLFKNKEINHEQLNRMMFFCINAGPAFIINVVGDLLLRNKFLGMLILTVQIFTSITMGVITGIIARLSKKTYYTNNNKNKYNSKLSGTFLESVLQTSNSTISMCSFIVIFTVIISLGNSIGILEYLSSFAIKFQINPKYFICLVISLLEITSGCSYASTNSISILIMSFIISYGGICTHLQLMSILKDTNFNYKKFNLMRLLSSTLTSIVTYLFLNTFEVQKSVFLSTIKTPTHTSISCSRVGSIAIVLLCIYFVISLPQKPLIITRLKKHHTMR